MANPIPTAPKGRPTRSSGGSYTPPRTTRSTGSSGSGSSGSGSKSSGSKSTAKASSKSGGSSSYDKYQKAAIARENKAKKKAGERYRDQATNLDVQAQALRRALRKEFRGALKIKLANVSRILGDQNAIVVEGYRERFGELKAAVDDNEKAEAQQSGINTNNRIRERNSALSEAMNMGAGESDILQAQMMSLRNWNANQSEIQRGFFDTLRSVNSSLTDLNIDTKTARANNQIQAKADKDQLWTNYYNQRSEAYTQLGNTLGQKADYLASAKEMGVGKGGGGAKKSAGGAFNKAARAAGQAKRNPGVSDSLMEWQGRGAFKGNDNASKLQTASVTRLDKRPEGSSLRKWTA